MASVANGGAPWREPERQRGGRRATRGRTRGRTLRAPRDSALEWHLMVLLAVLWGPPTAGKDAEEAALWEVYSQLGVADLAEFGARPYCDWEGVTCDQSTKSVAQIKLEVKYLSGIISPAISNLTSLRILNLSWNKLSGNIPSSIGNLSELTELNLSHNKLLGEIPASLIQLSNLQYLNLGYNTLKGQLPGGMSKLRNLQTLDLQDNQLSGRLDPEIMILKELRILSLRGNPFQSIILPQISNLKNLVALDLSNTLLYGALTPSISELPNLSRLSIAQCGLSGSIPDLRNLTRLISLDLSGNFFEDVPSGLPENISSVNFGSNMLQGPIPAVFDNLTNLEYLYLADNQFEGTVRNFSRLHKLKILSLAGNRLVGPLPAFSGKKDLCLLLINNPLCAEPLYENKTFCLSSELCSMYTGRVPLNFCPNTTCEGASTVKNEAAFLRNNACTCAVPLNCVLSIRNPYSLSFTESVGNEIQGAIENATNLTSSEVYLYLRKIGEFGEWVFGISMYFQPLPELINITIPETINSLYSIDWMLQFGPFSWGEWKYPILGDNFSDTTRRSPESSPPPASRKITPNGHPPPLSLSSPSHPSLSPHSHSPPPPLPPLPPSHERKNKLYWIVGVLCGASFVSVAALIIYFWRRYQHRKAAKEGSVLDRNSSNRSDSGMNRKESYKVRTIPLEEIKAAAHNFSEKSILGEGAYSTVYLGHADGMLWAIKRAKQVSGESRKMFQKEVEVMSQMNHTNLVRLVGCCEEEGEQILVCEYVPNGTLHSHLHPAPGTPPLSLEKRLRIATGAAEGLRYLHNFSHPTIVHRDVKSDNILLSDTFQAKIGDFGFLKNLPMGPGSEPMPTRAMGTPGYIDPEYYITYRVTAKSDVYSFGVVLFELITGQSPLMKDPGPLDSCTGLQEIVSIARWAKPKVEEGGIASIVDPSLGPDFPLDILAALFQIATACTARAANQRPEMTEVARRLAEVEAAYRNALRREGEGEGEREGEGEGGGGRRGEVEEEEEREGEGEGEGEGDGDGGREGGGNLGDVAVIFNPPEWTVQSSSTVHSIGIVISPTPSMRQPR